MNERDLFRALGDIDESLLPEPQVSRKKRSLRRYWPALAAACLCILILPALFFMNPMGKSLLASDMPAEARSEAPPERNGFFAFSAETAPAAAAETAPELAHLDGKPVTDATWFRLEWEGGIYDSREEVLYLQDRTAQLILDEEQWDEINYLLSTLPEPMDISALDEPRFALWTENGTYAYTPEGSSAVLEVCSHLQTILDASYLP